MALNGRLDELKPPEIFQLISLTRKSGKLILISGKKRGIVVFRKGRVVFAASNASHSSLDRAFSGSAFEPESPKIQEVRHQESRSATDSGKFLVAVRDTNSEVLEGVIRSQIETTVRELVEWKSGSFSFRAVDLPENDDIALESGWLQPGVDPDALVLNALTKLDEMERDRWQKDLDNAVDKRRQEKQEQRRKSEISAAFELLIDEDTGEVSWAPSPRSLGAVGSPGDLEKLRKITSEMAHIKGLSPTLTAEFALLILRYAAQVLNRGVLFAVRSDLVRGIGQFGLDLGDDSADRRVRELEIPLSEASVFASVLSSGQSFRGRLDCIPWNAHLIERLGGREPTEAIVVPLLVEGAPVCLLYGDNLPENMVIGTVDGIEILMHEIGLAVEKARLESRLRALEQAPS